MNQLVQDPQIHSAARLVEPLLLTVSFDVDQTSDQLEWRITPDSEPVIGRDSGAIDLAAGDTLGLEIVGYGRMADYATFQIVDCALVTRPYVVQCGAGLPTLYAAPSPFVQALGANYVLPLDFSSTVVDHLGPDGRHRKVQQLWKHTLNVNHAPGRWELSLVMTVRIMRGAGNVTELRVFSFDPECSVGDGTIPD